MADHTVIYNQGAQTLYHVPRDGMGRPSVASTPTYAIVDLREGEDTAAYTVVAAGTAATVDAVSQTLAADAGPTTAYPKRITVTDASEYAEGRRYLLQATDGRRELVTVEARDTASNYVYTLRDVKGDYASGAAVLRGVELQALFPSSEANDEDETLEDEGGPYAVVWTYTAGGMLSNSFETIRVRRYSMAPWIDVEDAIRAHPSLQDRIDRQLAADSVAVATEELAAELEAVGYIPANYRSSTFGRVMVRYLALSYMFRTLPGERDDELATLYHDKYTGMLHNMKTGEPPRDSIVVSEQDGDHVRGAGAIRSKFLDP